MRKTVVGIGEILWDMLPQGKQLGGAPANFAYHASQMGCDGVAVSAVGTDKLGGEIEQTLSECNFKTVLQHNTFPTGTVKVTLDTFGVPSYDITKNVAWDNIEYTEEMDALATKCDCVCFGSLAQRSVVSRTSIMRFLERMPENSIKIFDINIRQNFYNKELIEDSIKRATILKINDDELELVSPMLNLSGDIDNKCRQLLTRYGLDAVILTCGATGSSVYTADTVSHLTTPKVNVADTVGAGDSFTGAFCAALLNGKTIKEAHRIAVDVAAYVCTCSGAMPELPKIYKSNMTQMTKENSVMVLATKFADRGDWTVEQQFVLQMGSSYLLAHGIGTPLAKDAVTTVEVPADGEYTLYVRTKNWTKYWSEGPTPGIFQVKIDGKENDVTFGNEDVNWHWQKGAKVNLTKGNHTIALHDLTGFDGRCDAIILTTADEVPENSLNAYKELRSRLLGDNAPVDKGSFDLVVVGGGMSGICAAIAAARFGSKVALIQDRYILGGNNSSEVRVGLGGQINVPPYPSLGYIFNEIGPDRIGNARGAHHYQDYKKMDVVLAEKNITLFLGYTVDAVEMDVDKIKSVTAVEATNQDRIKISGKLFSDCTGDAHLAVLAGAETMMGREAASEYGERLAPEKADGMTMGVSIEWYCEDWNTPCDFPDSLDWGLKLDEYTVEPVHRANWYWEVGMNDDQVADAEKIRDYGMYVAYSTFSYCKNRYSKKEDWICTHLVWVSHVSGKRESRRIKGDLVLREQDLTRPIRYEDETCTTTWRIDQHYPLERNAKEYPGAEWLSYGVLTPIDFYALPYRCFYSKDVANMFMAGRNISVSHIALGSVRVMRTCGMMGEVVGMAANICAKHNAMPRDIYTTYFAELQELMRKGAGRTDVPYTQFYHQIDRTGHWAEDR